MFKVASFVCLFIIASFFSACTVVLPVERAFSGDLTPKEEIKTVIDYCQSCHLHRDFAGADHLAKAPALYSKEPYKSATSCTVCHGVTRNFWNDIIRFTHAPDGRIVND